MTVSQNQRQTAVQCRQWDLALLLQLVERKNQFDVTFKVNVSAIFQFWSEKL
jgi:hypothetical protein